MNADKPVRPIKNANDNRKLKPTTYLNELEK